MAGLIHIYCGDGKGKTTAAVGLAVRAAGAGKKAVFTQFFKDGSSSEVSGLQRLAGIKVMYCQTVKGFFRHMSDAEKARASEDYTRLFAQVLDEVVHADLLILDEIVSACNYGVIAQAAVTGFLRKKPKNLEVVLTGRSPSEELLALADYVTEMRKIKHPYDVGITARRGIEY